MSDENDYGDFIVFGGAQCYPSGGARDILPIYTNSRRDAIDQAKGFLDKRVRLDSGWSADIDWIQVYDVMRSEVVFEEGSLPPYQIGFIEGLKSEE